MSNFLKLNLGDLGRGLVVAVFAAVFTQLASVLNTPGFELAGFDWTETLRIAFAAAVGYLSKNMLTDSSGKFMGRM